MEVSPQHEVMTLAARATPLVAMGILSVLAAQILADPVPLTIPTVSRSGSLTKDSARRAVAVAGITSSRGVAITLQR